MKKRILLFLSLVFCISAAAVGQTKTVTNADLEKFRQERLAAEKDYLENYARLGFPSPQERERQIAESRRELDELSARFQAERLERERMQLVPLQTVFVQSQSKTRVVRNNYYGSSAYFSPYGYFSLPVYRGYYVRRSRYRRNNTIQPIRPPKPIRPPRIRIRNR